LALRKLQLTDEEDEDDDNDNITYAAAKGRDDSADSVCIWHLPRATAKAAANDAVTASSMCALNKDEQAMPHADLQVPNRAKPRQVAKELRHRGMAPQKEG
jgi:hypothetical protein